MFIIPWLWDFTPFPSEIDAVATGGAFMYLMTWVEPALDIPDHIRARLRARKIASRTTR